MTKPGPKLMAFQTLAACIYLGLAILGSGGFAAFFSHPPLMRNHDCILRAAGSRFLHRGKSQFRRARGPLQPLGAAGFRRYRLLERLSARLHGQDRVLDD